MAEGGLKQLDKIYTLGSVSGISRDPTALDKSDYDDGVWMRFSQWGLPRKIPGYTRVFQLPTAIPRGVLTHSSAGVNYIVSGDSSGVWVFQAGTATVSGTGPFKATIAQGYALQTVASVPSQTSFTISGSLAGLYPAATKVIFNSATSQTVYLVQTATVSGMAPNQVTTVTTTTAFVGTPTSVYVYGPAFVSDSRYQWTFDIAYDVSRKQQTLVAHPALTLANIDNQQATPIYFGPLIPDATGSWTLTPLADVDGANPTFQIVSSTNGFISMYPFMMTFGASGFVAVNNVNTLRTKVSLQDWNGNLADQVNISATNIMAAKLVRGGSASPSALLFSQDQLTRISFNAGGTPRFWNYDIVSAEISIMSGRSVVQVGSGYMWPGLTHFMQYNGTVQSIDNQQNQNYFYDNLNFTQRAKVWGLNYPRWNEVWWYYPHGNSTECNNVIVFNYKLNRWFDLGLAAGCRRSCGYAGYDSFAYPFIASWDFQAQFLASSKVVLPPTGGMAPNPTTTSFYVGPGDLTPLFAPGAFVALNTEPTATIYRITTSRFYFVSASQNATLVTVDSPIGILPVDTIVYPSATIGYPIYVHEFGKNQVDGSRVQSVYSSFTTNLSGFPVGDLAQDALTGIERNMRIVRVEPNFVQTGNMNMYIIGQGFGSSDGTKVVTIGPEVFDSERDYIDWRQAEFRLLKFKFESDAIDGDYQMGKILVTCDYGSKRPSGT